MSYFKDVEISGPSSAFGEVLMVSPEPSIQVVLPYANTTEQLTTAASGTAAAVSWAAGLLSLRSGTANGGTATLVTHNVLRYGAGQGADVRFACIFSTGVAGATQMMGIGDLQDGFFFGYNGTAFGIMRRQAGSDNWTAQTSWSVDKFNGSGLSGVTLDPTKGNVYRIVYQWLGFGMITFQVENPSTGGFTTVHRIQYANANTTLSIRNPTLPIRAETLNTSASNNDATIQTGSMAGFTQGHYNGGPTIRYGTTTTLLNVSTEAAVFTLKNKATNVLGGTNTNRTPCYIDWVSIACEGTKPAVIRMLQDTTLGGTPAYADIAAATSTMQKDVAGTTVTGGTQRWGMVLGKSSNAHVDVSLLRLHIHPGETVAFAAQSAANSDVSISVGWRELQ